MDDMMMEQRIRNILEQKAQMGAGEGVMVGGRRHYRRRRAPVRRRRHASHYGHGGVMVGGYRRRRAPSEWNLAVGDYMHRHPGATLAEAAHALRRSGRSRPRRRAPVRRRRRSYGRGEMDDYDEIDDYGEGVLAGPYGRGVMVGGRRSHDIPEDYYISRADAAKLRREEKAADKAAFCSRDALDRRLSRARSVQEVRDIRRQCGLTGLERKRRTFRHNLRQLSGSTGQLYQEPAYVTEYLNG